MPVSGHGLALSRRVFTRVVQAFDIPISWWELLKRTVKEAIDDDALGLSAQLAFYFFLALFPTLLFLLALIGFLPVDRLAEEALRALSRFAPPDVLGIIRDQITKISEGENGGLLTAGFVGALWSSSAAMVAIVNALNRAFDIEDSRPWWKARLTAIGLTVTLAVFMLLSFVLVVAGPSIAESIASAVGLGEAFEWTWKIVQWPVAFLLVSTGVGLVYYFGPDAEQDWVWLTPGALLATLLWLIASLAFRFYIVNFTNYNETYGTVGGFIVLMLWFYLSGMAIVIGAEMAAEIEKLLPYQAKLATPKGVRKKLGLAARRECERRDLEEQVLAALRPEPAPVPPRRRFADVALGVPAFLVAMAARWRSSRRARS